MAARCRDPSPTKTTLPTHVGLGRGDAAAGVAEAELHDGVELAQALCVRAALLEGMVEPRAGCVDLTQELGDPFGESDPKVRVDVVLVSFRRRAHRRASAEITT